MDLLVADGQHRVQRDRRIKGEVARRKEGEGYMQRVLRDGKWSMRHTTSGR